MPVQQLNHININAPQPMLDALRDFYTDILGLTVGWRPDVQVPGYWLYSGDLAVIHLMDAPGNAGKPVNTGVIGSLDHFAFSCTDLEGMEMHLQRHGQHYLRRDFPGFNTVQLVIHDPTGMAVELNFSL